MSELKILPINKRIHGSTSRHFIKGENKEFSILFQKM
jgi:hypothetical protein